MKKKTDTESTARKATVRKATARKTVTRKTATAKKETAAKAPKAPATVPVAFTIAAAPDVPVFLAGTFNNWDAESIRLDGVDGVYSTTLELTPGSYEYKFIVNGFWTMDPDPSREWVPNGLGTLNSVVVVK